MSAFLKFKAYEASESEDYKAYNSFKQKLNNFKTKAKDTSSSLCKKVLVLNSMDKLLKTNSSENLRGTLSAQYGTVEEWRQQMAKRILDGAELESEDILDKVTFSGKTDNIDKVTIMLQCMELSSAKGRSSVRGSRSEKKRPVLTLKGRVISKTPKQSFKSWL